MNEANVFSSNSDMWRNRQANANLFKIFLTNMMKAIMFLEGKESNKDYTVALDDSMIINDDQRLKDMKEDANDGYIAKWRYVAEKYNIGENEAKKMVEEAEEERDNRNMAFISTVEEEEEVPNDGEES